jgi:VanZ family protein
VVFSVDGDPALGLGRWNKVAHAGIYAMMTGSFLLAMVWRPGRGNGPAPRAGALITLAAVALGIGLEVAQGPVVGRSPEVADALSDLAGVAVAWATWWLLRAGAEARTRPSCSLRRR